MVDGLHIRNTENMMHPLEFTYPARLDRLRRASFFWGAF